VAPQKVREDLREMVVARQCRRACAARAEHALVEAQHQVREGEQVLHLDRDPPQGLATGSGLALLAEQLAKRAFGARRVSATRLGEGGCGAS